MLTDFDPKEVRTVHRLLVGPTQDPVALDIARQHLRQDQTFDDVMIAIYLKAATAAVEQAIGRVLIAQRWEYTTNDYSDNGIRLPYSPVISIDSVVSVADDASTTALTSYRSFLPSGPNAASAEINFTSPPSGMVRVTYTAGYGASAESVPPALGAAVLLMLGSLYENREAEAEVGGSAARSLAENPAFLRLIRPYQLIG